MNTPPTLPRATLWISFIINRRLPYIMHHWMHLKNILIQYVGMFYKMSRRPSRVLLSLSKCMFCTLFSRNKLSGQTLNDLNESFLRPVLYQLPLKMYSKNACFTCVSRQLDGIFHHPDILKKTHKYFYLLCKLSKIQSPIPTKQRHGISVKAWTVFTFQTFLVMRTSCRGNRLRLFPPYKPLAAWSTYSPNSYC